MSLRAPDVHSALPPKGAKKSIGSGSQIFLPQWGVLEASTAVIHSINFVLKTEWEDVTLGICFMTHLRPLREGNKGTAEQAL